MTDQDKLIYGLIFSIIGISLGWILNQLASWVKSRNTDKRNLKRILFILLETNFLIARSDFNQFRKLMINALNEINPNPKNASKALEIMKSVIEGSIVTLLQDEVFEKYKNAKIKYLDAIDKLSEIDPVHAYYLHGNTNAIDIIEKFEPLIASMQDNNILPEQKNEILKFVMEKLQPDFFNDTLVRLEEDILNVAKKINWITYFKSKKAIKKAQVNTEENLNRVIVKWKEVFGDKIQDLVS